MINSITKSSIFRIYKLLKLKTRVVRLLEKERKVFEGASLLNVESFRKIARSYNAIREGSYYHNVNNKLVIKYGDRYIGLSINRSQIDHRLKEYLEICFDDINSYTLTKYEIKQILKDIINRKIFVKYNKEICYYLYFFVIRELLNAKLSIKI